MTVTPLTPRPHRPRHPAIWLALILLACLALLPPVARASGTPPAYARALDLAAQNRLEDALAVLDRWKPTTLAEIEQKLWARAVILRKLGRPQPALVQLEELVARRPDIPRFRSALAEVLAETGQAERARAQDQGGLGIAATDVESTRRTLGYGALVTPENWSGELGFAVIPATNAAQRTSAQTITIGGQTFVINDTARKSAATGLNLRAGLTFAPRLNDTTRLKFGLIGDLYHYRGNAPDDFRFRAVSTATLRLSDKTLFEGGLTYSMRFLDGREYSRGPGLTMALVHTPDKVSRVEVFGSVDRLSHARLTGLDGSTAVAVAAYSRAVTPQLLLRGSLRLERADLASSYASQTTTGLGIGGTYFFKGGLRLGLDMSMAWSDYDSISPIYGKVREDTRNRTTLRVSHSRFTIRDFAPVLELEYEKRSSNIPVYSFDNLSAQIGLTRRF